MFKKVRIPQNLLKWVDPKQVLECTQDVKGCNNGNFSPIIYRNDLSLSQILSADIIEMFQMYGRWDFKKYDKIADLLECEGLLDNESSFLKCRRIKESELLKLHTKEYLDYLSTTEGFSKVFVYPNRLKKVLEENDYLMDIFLRTLQIRTAGTILANEISLKTKFGLMIGGGLHHASSNVACGWCSYGDIQLSILNLRERYDKKNTKNYGTENIFIIDVDSHHANGICLDKKNKILDENVIIIDLFNKDIWPFKGGSQCPISIKDSLNGCNIPVPLPSLCKDEEYLHRLNNAINEGIETYGFPDIVYYNAGLDILKGDKYGKLSITEEGLLQRDEMVFKKFGFKKDSLSVTNKNKIAAITMTISGGYLKKNPKVLVKSLKNLNEKFGILNTRITLEV